MKVGDYVRTDTGQIGKITYFEGDMVRVDCDKFITYKNNHDEITKISPNIIDLIEVGDYVNGSVVDFISFDKNYYGIEGFGGMIPKCSFKKNIKSIVTKEQFSSMEYKVN